MMSMTTLTVKNFGLMCMVVALSGSFAMTAEAQSVNKRLDIIEKQLKAVQRKVFTPGSEFTQQKGGATVGPGPAISGGNVSGGNVKFADIETRISQMETQLRQLTGRIEESVFQVDNLKQRMEIMSRDYEYRFKELEAANSATAKPATAKPAMVKSVDPSAGTGTILPAGSEQQQYSYAQRLVTTTQYAKAEAALGEFLKAHPASSLAGNAQYWLGQTYYVRKMYTKATRAFLEGYNNYPKSAKAPAFLLKIGMSLYAMGEKKDACDAYRELAIRFPDSTESTKSRPPEEKRAGCT